MLGRLRHCAVLCLSRACAAGQAEAPEGGGFCTRANELVAFARTTVLSNLPLTNRALHHQWSAYLPCMSYLLRVRIP